MSYKAYKDKNGNYEIKDSKDEALEGVGRLAGGVLGAAILAPFAVFDKLSAKNGKLLGTDEDNFIILLDGHEKKYPIKFLESVHYGFNSLKFKFIDSPKITVLQINESKIKNELIELYTMLNEKQVEPSLVAPYEIIEWHTEFMQTLHDNNIN